MRFVVLGAAAVLLAGCELTLDIDVAVDGEAGGWLAVALSADAELQQIAEQAGADPLTRMAQRVRDLEAEWQVSEEVEQTDGRRTVSLRSEFASPEEFAVRYGEMVDALDAPEARLLGPLSLAVDEEADLISLTGELPLEVTQVAAEEFATDVADLTARLDGVVTSGLTVTTPGAVVRTNAAQVVVDGQTVAEPYPDAPATLSWQTRPGAVTAVSATFERGGLDLLRLGLLVGAGVGALLLIGGGVLAQRRRR